MAYRLFFGPLVNYSSPPSNECKTNVVKQGEIIVDKFKSSPIFRVNTHFKSNASKEDYNHGLIFKCEGCATKRRVKACTNSKLINHHN